MIYMQYEKDWQKEIRKQYINEISNKNISLDQTIKLLKKEKLKTYISNDKEKRAILQWTIEMLRGQSH